MSCPACAHENPADSRFCFECGASLAIRCARCEAELPAQVKFCNRCGNPTARTASEVPKRDPRAYTPKHLAEKILRSKSALEGERKQVTVLFADVKGSLELAEQVDPEEWHRILERFFQILTDGVHRFEGTVNQYTGDGIMALFGAPIAHEDHARRACYAALHLGEELRHYADELRRSRGLNFSVRMGVNSGEVVVGKIGDDLRMDYTAQGHTVGLAARMEQLAAPDRVNLAEHTASLVSGFFRLRDLGPFGIKGVSDPLRVYELEGVGPLRTRLDVSRARGFSRFVGRDEETASVEAAFRRAADGYGQVVGVVGEAGVGKSRLCFEFVEGCRARGMAVREGHGVAHGKMIPFLPVLELLRGYFEITDQDSGRTARTKIAGVLLLLDRELETALPSLFEFLGVADPDKPAPTMAPDARQRLLFGVVRKLIRAASEQRPGVILIEDLHWIDGGTAAFLADAVEAVAGTRTVLLVNFRPEYRAEWMQKSYYQQLPLLPLGADAIRELLEDLLGRDSSLTGLAERIQERTAGNPFFVEEVVRSLAETGSLAGTRSAYRLVHPVAELAIPSTVQAVLAARIDRLAEREKLLLQISSVIGKQFSEGILRRVVELTGAGCSEADLAGGLRTLVTAEFLYEEALYPEAEYAFKHPLTQEVAYASQLGERRAHVHAAVAGAIAARDPDKLDERAALLAHHWEQAGDSLQAARWHRRAAEWVGLSQPSEGFSHWHKVRDLLALVPSSPETENLGAVARSQLLYLGARVAAAAEEMEALFREGSELARRTGNDAALAWLSSSYGIFTCYTTGIVEDGLGHLSRAVELADRTDDLGLRIAARYNAAGCCSFGGRFELALTLTAEVLELCGDDPEVGAHLIGMSPWVMGRVVRTGALCRVGRIREVRPLLDAVFEFARERADGMGEGVGHYEACEHCLMAGDPAGAVEHGRQSIERAERLGSQPMRILGYQALGAAFVLDGQWEEAVPVLEHAIVLLTDGRTFRFLEGQCLADLARAFLGCGEAERARETARAAVRVGEGNGWLAECEGQLALAHVLAQTEGRGAAQKIVRAIDRAAELVALSGGRSREPVVHEQRADLARLLGDDTTWERELREAHRLFTEIGATGHAGRVAKALGSREWENNDGSIES